jgi:hypothetical protein
LSYQCWLGCQGRTKRGQTQAPCLLAAILGPACEQRNTMVKVKQKEKIVIFNSRH